MNEEIILSVTSYPKRIGTVAEMLRDILNQTTLPDRIILWLNYAEFADCKIPADLLALIEENDLIELRYGDENLKPHDKYYWSMVRYPEACVITIDDDLFYDHGMVARLIEAHKRWPYAIIASRSHLVTLGENGDIAPYKEWVHEQEEFLDAPRFDLLATSGAGTLFPPHLLPAEAFDRQKLTELTPITDDLWLMTWALLSNIPVVATGNPHLTYVDNTQQDALCIINLENGGNDVVLEKLFEAFPRFHERLLAEVRIRTAQLGH